MEKQQEWWVDEAFLISQVTSEESYIEDLMGRRLDDGSWEYAFVKWSFHNPYLMFRIHEGKLIKEE